MRQLQRGYPTTGRYSVGGRRAEPRMTVLLHTCSTSEKDILKTVTVKFVAFISSEHSICPSEAPNVSLLVSEAVIKKERREKREKMKRKLGQ